ncbi:MAG: DUF2285 domain-containing protein [Pseudomonadota bacterium]|nr:DUF2285 domain-containing protein [Pseudomonadota bacterium]
MTDWGLPDWTKQKEYPSPVGPGRMTVWTWEFLRRNPAYRAFWMEKIQPFVGVYGFIDRDAAGNFWPYLDELRSRFGVEIPSPPQSATPSHFAANYISWVQNERGEDQRISLERHQVAYIFDLTRPLKHQFEMAEKSASREQEFRQKSGAINLKVSRNRDDEKFVLYLRILDAVEAGARPKDIGALLLPDILDDYDAGNRRSKALVDKHKAAQKLRDGGYRSLLDLE